ncbi:MAG: hypothetical protein WCJ14_07835 [Verrucomicrobiota bacterium]
MTDPSLFWFHCGRCGSLFRSPLGDEAHRLCSKCGANPSLGILESPADAVTPSVGTIPAAATPGKLRTRSGKLRSSRYLMWQLAVGWTLVLALIVGGARWLWPVEELSVASTAGTQKAADVSNEDAVFLNNVGPKCNAIFSGFLAAGTPEARNQFVLKPVLTSTRMARFYSLNPLANVDPATLQPARSAVLKLPDGKAVETLWNWTDGRQIDAVFREENGEWRLDWDHYARYSDYPWALFLSGSGVSEGEFRLLARERLADERKGADTISLVLYAPRFGQPGEVGFQSPEFLVSRNSRDGQLLDAAFKLARRGGQVFGSQLKNLNPEGMIRVRLKVRRLEVNLERKFEIAQVAACHWYAVDEPGVEPIATVAAPPQSH